MRSAILVSQVITTEYFMCVRAHTNRLEHSFSAFIAYTLEARIGVCSFRRGDGVVW
jgi:hypothetical protein